MTLYLRRRDMQLSLATLFLVVSAIAAVAGWFGMGHRAAIREDKSLRLIMKKGGAIDRDFKGRVIVDFTVPRDEILARMFALKIAPGEIVRCPFSDSDLPLLDYIIELEKVDFHSSHVTVKAARQFQQTHPTCRVNHPEFPPTDLQ